MAVSYYRILGVAPTAGHAELKKAYRELARRFHPDRNQGHPLAESRFRLISEAWSVLGETDDRRKYDQFGPVGLMRGRSRPGVAGSVERLVTNLESFVDSRMKRTPKRGKDKRRQIQISLSQAVYGGEIGIDVIRREKCPDCSGLGCEPGTYYDPCHVCDGHGAVKSGNGLLAVTEGCPFCGGLGKLAQSPCQSCGGVGERDVSRHVTLEIPAGVQTGRRLALRGYGEPGQSGGQGGDLFVELTVQPHPHYQRNGDDLTCVLPIRLSEAVLGGQAAVPLLDSGAVTIRIPVGSQSGQTLRLRGRGGKRANGSSGDLFVELRIETPVVDETKIRSVLASLDQLSRYPKRAALQEAIDAEKPDA